MRLRWIDEQLETRGLPRKALADAIPTLNESKLSLVMSGHRKLSATEADQIRRFFGYRLPDDPPRHALDLVVDRLARLDERQIPAVALYLEALMGAASERRQAS
jgi:hypothetical protein